MNIISVLQFLGGIGLFLFGMNLMSSSIEKLAGSRLEKVLETVTTSKNKSAGKVKGWGFGIGVTAILQSSAAITIMLVGFINAGIMKVAQAMPVVFGSNVGSTVTAQMLRLGDIGEGNAFLKLLRPASLAPILVGIGAFIILFTKKKKAKNIASVLVGLGMLFYGMTVMEDVLSPLSGSAKLQSLIDTLENPLFGILIGLVLTIILQSSNASVGILQALTVTGTISYAVAVPVIIGQNLGKCSSTILGGIGANKKAKRLVVGYVFFNIFGAIFFSVAIYILDKAVGLAIMDSLANRSSVATLHLLFNLLTSILLLPFSRGISEFTERVVGGDDEKPEDKELAKLDDMLLNTPTIALQQCRSLIYKMSESISENYKLATSMIYQYDEAKLTQMEENEAFIDKCETVLSAYIVRIDRKRLTTDDKLLVNEILNSIGDFERVGDYCMNIAYVAREKNEQEIHFSPAGHMETEDIIDAVDYTLELTFKAFRDDDVSLAIRVDPLSEVIDELKEIIKSHHVERLQEGTCSIEGGVSLFDLVNSFERIASHAANIALHVIKKVLKDRDFDEMHGHASDNLSEEYKAMYHYYESKYIEPVISFSEPKETPVKTAKAKEEAKSKAATKPKDTAKPKDSEKQKDSSKLKDEKSVKDSKDGKGSKDSKENKEKDIKDNKDKDSKSQKSKKKN